MKTAAAIVGALLILAVVLFAIAGILVGIKWIAIHLLQSLVPATEIAFAFCILILLPMCIFRKTRPWAGIGFYFSSFVFGIGLWFSQPLCALKLMWMY